MPSLAELERATHTLFTPGRNCWQVPRADRFACVQDAADYFRLVRQALLAARHSVFILGWDIQARLDLLAGQASPDGAPTRLDALLKFIVRRRPALRCHLLIWDHAALFTLERDPLSRWRLGWAMPSQVKFGFDDFHPVGASHHQKLVVIDDALAFCGGIDLTGHRWDTPAHRVHEPARVDMSGAPYGPYHEVQAMVSGPAAASLGRLARERWQRVMDSPVPPVRDDAAPLWLADVEADCSDVDVAIARTLPGSDREPAVRECEALFEDSIAAARELIYIENQYATNERLGAALAARLREPAGPEVILVIPNECTGWIEQQSLGVLRDRLIRSLRAADRYERLRVLYPLASRASHTGVFVHSKVTVVDDRLLRIGSANFTGRSMGVDTECDLALDAAEDADRRHEVAVVRNRLIGEHLGLTAVEVADALRRLGSIRGLVDACGGADRTLEPIPTPPAVDAPDPLVAAAADPVEPIRLGPDTRRMLPPLDARTARGPMRLWLPPLAVFAAVAAIALHTAWGPGVREWLQAGPGGLWGALVAFVAAHVLLVPLEVLAVCAGFVFGFAPGAVVVLAGAQVAAVLGYLAGWAIGVEAVHRWIPRRSYRSIRQLAGRGVTGLVLLRLASVASGGSVHLAFGAMRHPFTRYFVGSMLGLAPVLVLLTAVGAVLRRAILDPQWVTWGTALAVLLAAVGVAAGLRTVLLLRQFTPAASRASTFG